jgi:glycosyltransferase involved in cell wall biosynthesis
MKMNSSLRTLEKKCTFLISTLGGGGAEGVCVSLANELSEQGWSISLVVLTLDNAVYLERLSPNVLLINLNVGKARRSIQPLYRYFTTNKPSTLLVFNYELAILANIIKRLFNFKFRLIARNINTLSSVLSHMSDSYVGKVQAYLIKHYYGRSDYIINQSQGMYDDLIDVYPQIGNKSSVIHNPVNPFYRLENCNHLSGDRDNYILCVGRLEQQKGFDRAIYSFSEILKTDGNLRLKIVGNGSLKASLEALAEELKVTENIDFLPFRGDLRELYYKAQLTLLTSHYEGFPNTLVESISMGTPVVSLNCPSGPNEIICDDNGILVDEIAHLSGACIGLMKACLPRVTILTTSDRFNVKYVANRYIELLEKN